MDPQPTPPLPPTQPVSPGPAPAAPEDAAAETRRLLAEAKAAFAAEQAAADAEEAAEGPSVFERGRKLVDDVRDDPVQAVADRLDDRLGDHKKAVALALVAGGAVVLLQSKWVRKKALPVVATAGTAFVQDKIRDWFKGEEPKSKARKRTRKPPVDERPERTVADTLDEEQPR